MFFQKRCKNRLTLPLFLLLSIIFAFLIMFLVYRIPVDHISENVRSGIDVMIQEGAEYNYIEDYKSAILDNQTDAVLLSMAVYPTNHSLSDAMLNPYISYNKHMTQETSLVGYLNNDPSPYAVNIYPRYWNGAVAFIKIFFSFFTYSQFRILNQSAQMVLFVLCVLAMSRKGLSYFLPAFVFMILFWNPATMGVSLQYAPCYYISMSASLFVLLLNPSRRSEALPLLFLTTGIMTAWLDFLTYPLVTLALPLIFCVVISDQNYPFDIMQTIKASFIWVFGYGGMWAGKWLTASIITKTDVIADAIFNVGVRMSSSVESEEIIALSRLDIVLYLIRVSLLRPPYLIIGILVLIITILQLTRSAQMNRFPCSTQKEAQLILIALMPLVWFFLI